MKLNCLSYWIQVFLVVVSSAVPCRAQDSSKPSSEEILVADLRSEKLAIRRSSVISLSNIDRELKRTALPVLIDLLKTEKDGQVRLAIFDAIVEMGSDAATSVPALVQSFRSSYGEGQTEKRHQDYRAAIALAAIGPPAVDGLRSLLKEKKENVRAEAAMALGRIGPDAEAAIPDLISQLSDEKERVRKEVSLALGRIGTAATESLISASTHQDLLVRVGAVSALGLLPMPDDQVREAIVRSALDAEPTIRAAAIKSTIALQLSDESLLKILSENIRHENESVRVAVINVLTAQPSILPRLIPELVPLLSSDNASVSRHAAFLIQKLGADAAPLLLNTLRSEKSSIEQIGESLAHLGRPIVGVLVQAMDDPEPRVQRGAAIALGQILPATSEAIEKLTYGLNHSNPDVQAACLASIGRLGARARTSVPAVRAKLRDESEETRLLAIDILFQAAPRDSRLLDDFLSALNDESPRVQRRAIDTIRYLGPLGRRSLPVAIDKLKASDPDVRIAAAALIGSHGRAASEAVPTLISLLNDPSADLQATIAQVLGQLGEAARPALPELVRLLESEHAKVRSAVAIALGGLELEPDIARPHLAKTLRDREADVRKAGLAGVQRFGRRAAVFIPDIIEVAEYESERSLVRESLKRFERAGPDPRSIPELIALLKHSQAPVQLLAIQFLGLAGQPASEAIVQLESLSEDPSEEVRSQSKKAIDLIKNAPARRPRP